MSTTNAKPQISIEPVRGIQFKYFHVSEVAAMLRVSSQVIYQLIHERNQGRQSLEDFRGGYNRLYSLFGERLR